MKKRTTDHKKKQPSTPPTSKGDTTGGLSAEKFSPVDDTKANITGISAIDKLLGFVGFRGKSVPPLPPTSVTKPISNSKDPLSESKRIKWSDNNKPSPYNKSKNIRKPPLKKEEPSK